MLNLVKSRSNINSLLNSAFLKISEFFSGSQNVVIQEINPTSMPFSDPGTYSNFTREWVLHQSISDIVVKDINASFGWIFPASFSKVADKIRKDILFFFYSDIIDEVGETENKEEGYSEITLGLQARILTFNSGMIAWIKSGTIAFHDGFARMKKRILGLKETGRKDNTFYLLGNFSPFLYQDISFRVLETSCEGENINFTPSFFFHKRN